MTGVPGWAWAVVVCVISGLLAIDLLASRRAGTSRAVLVSAAWVGAGAGFGLVLTLWQGASAGQQYFAAYVLEKALSVDNLRPWRLAGWVRRRGSARPSSQPRRPGSTASPG